MCIQERRNLIAYIKDYCRTTTVHGLSHLIQTKNSLERIFWSGVLIFVIYGCISLSLRNWDRYQTNPSVVSIQKDFRNWYNIFPAHTVCLQNKADARKLKKFILNTWGITPTNSTKYVYFSRFITQLTNVSFESMLQMAEYANDSQLNNIDILGAIDAVHPDFNLKIITENPNRNWTRILTENGICHSHNSVLGQYIDFNIGKKVFVDKSAEPITCHFSNRQCYARLDSKAEWITNIFSHSPLEMIDFNNINGVVLTKGVNYEINYNSLETRYTTELKELSPSQRRCRFFHEPIGRNAKPAIYTPSICKTQCKARFITSLCGCVPHFYRSFSDSNICNLKGLVCIAQHIEQLKYSKDNHWQHCRCPQACMEVSIIKDVERKIIWTGYLQTLCSYRWAMTPPRIRLNREVIFGFEDAVVAFGGIAAFFLGISFLSFMEFFHYFIFALKGLYEGTITIT